MILSWFYNIPKAGKLVGWMIEISRIKYILWIILKSDYIECTHNKTLKQQSFTAKVCTVE